MVTVIDDAVFISPSDPSVESPSPPSYDSTTEGTNPPVEAAAAAASVSIAEDVKRVKSSIVSDISVSVNLLNPITPVPLVDTTLLSIDFTFPTIGGPWQVQGSYTTLWSVDSGRNYVNCWLYDSVNNFRFVNTEAPIYDEMNTGIETTSQIYQNNDVVTFVCQLSSANTLTVLEGSSMTVTAVPIYPTKQT